jgi:hypothetical protein
LTLDVRETEHAHGLQHLKSTLKSAYKIVRENSRKSHVTNKQYYNRRKKEKSFQRGDIVYCTTQPEHRDRVPNFFCLARTFRVIARLSKLNYRVEDQQGKEFVVHINCIKRAFKQEIWKTKVRERCYRNSGQEPEQEEDEQVVLVPRPVSIPVPQKGNRRKVPRTPDRSSQYNLDTPSTAPRSSNAREARNDPNYVLPNRPLTGRELGSTRTHPPLTRLQSSLQALDEAAVS